MSEKTHEELDAQIPDEDPAGNTPVESGTDPVTPPLVEANEKPDAETEVADALGPIAGSTSARTTIHNPF